MVYNSFAELNARYGEKDRQDMSPEEHRQFVADCFDTYEAIGFAKRFQSPYSVGTVRKFSGMTFTVNGRLTADSGPLMQRRDVTEPDDGFRYFRYAVNDTLQSVPAARTKDIIHRRIAKGLH